MSIAALRRDPLFETACREVMRRQKQVRGAKTPAGRALKHALLLDAVTSVELPFAEQAPSIAATCDQRPDLDTWAHSRDSLLEAIPPLDVLHPWVRRLEWTSVPPLKDAELESLVSDATAEAHRVVLQTVRPTLLNLSRSETKWRKAKKETRQRAEDALASKLAAVVMATVLELNRSNDHLVVAVSGSLVT